MTVWGSRMVAGLLAHTSRAEGQSCGEATRCKTMSETKAGEGVRLCACVGACMSARARC